MKPFKRIECRSLDELFRELSALEGWIFRGHCSAGWSLQTTLERRTPPGDSGLHTEFNIVRGFKRRAHNYLGPNEMPSSPGEWLSLMAHYGAPTRLLDFTWSPFVAAYFAFEELPGDGCTECAIIAGWPSWFHDRLGAFAFANGGLFGFPTDAIRDGVAAMKLAPPATNLPDNFAAGTILGGKVEGHALDQAPSVVALFEPNRLTERMSIQQGVFLWPGNPALTLMENLELFGDLRDGFRVLTIPASERGRAIDQLRLMNITRTSLFPGLDGFAHSFRQLPVRESANSRALRTAILGLVPGPEGR
jgi:hypothetical protein